MTAPWIAGWGITPFGRHEGTDLETLAATAAREALLDSGLAPGRIELAVFANALAARLSGSLTIGQDALAHVGRGEHQSYCFLHPSGVLGEVARERLMAIEDSQDGFDLAEKDLQLRGAGNIFGTEQSGFQQFKLGTMEDIDLMSFAKDFAKELLDQSPDLSTYPKLKNKLTDYVEAVHLE